MSTKKLRELQQRRAEAFDAADAIVNASDDHELGAEEQEAFDKHMGEIEDLDAQIDRLKKLEATRGRIDDSEQEQPHPGRFADSAPREFESVGEFLSMARFNPNDQRLADLWNDGLNAEQSMGEGSSGGFMVPQQFRDTILSVDPQEAIVRPRASVIPAGSPPDSSITMPALDQTGDAPANRYGGVTMEWIGEGATKPDTDTGFREITLAPQELAGTMTVTDKLLRNWGAASSFLERQMRGALIASQDRAFLRGDGVAKPRGIYNSPAAYKINRDTANQIQYVDLVAMEARMHGSMVWVLTQSALPQLRQLVDSAGNNIYTDAREGLPGVLMGYPVLINERAPSLGSLGDIALCDMSYYLIKDGSGPFVAFSEHVHFTRNKTVMKIFTNVDGQTWLTEPFKQENGWEVSPFVLLDVPA